MVSPSTSSNVSSTQSDSAQAAAPPTQRIVAELVALSRDRTEFLNRLAAHLVETMSAAAVVVRDATLSEPRLLVRDQAVATMIDRAALPDQLASVSPQVSLIQMMLQKDGVTIPCSGVGVQVLPAPDVACLLLINGTELTPESRLPAMKLIADYAKESRLAMARRGDLLSATATKSTALASLENGAAIRASLRSFHQDLDPIATAYRIAAEMPRLLPCDRAVVLLPRSKSRRRPRYRVVAISGSSVIDKRSPLVRSINRLASAVAVLKRSIVLPPSPHADTIDPASESPQLIEPLEEYLDESGVLSVALVPLFESAIHANHDLPDADVGDKTLRRTPMPIAMLMLETFSGEPITAITPAADEVAHESASALFNAIQYDGVFAMPVRRPMATATRRAVRHWLLAIALLVTAASVAGWMIHVDHHVIAIGVARPAERRAIFAGVDGVVGSLHVADGDSVRAGDVLVTLDNSELTREAEQLSGQLATATQKLASIRSMLLAGEDDLRQVAQSVIEQQSLENEIQTLNERIEINREMKDQLSLRSPLDGTVVGWQLNQRLADRPVSRGDRLFAIVQTDGDWQLELKLDETRAGEVLRRHHAGETISIRFAIETRPTETFDATVVELGGVARRRADGRNVVDVIARIDDFPPGGFRGDAEVTAKVICGRRRFLVSALDDVVSWWHRNVMFRFR